MDPRQAPEQPTYLTGLYNHSNNGFQPRNLQLTWFTYVVVIIIAVLGQPGPALLGFPQHPFHFHNQPSIAICLSFPLTPQIARAQRQSITFDFAFAPKALLHLPLSSSHRPTAPVPPFPSP